MYTHTGFSTKTSVCVQIYQIRSSGQPQSTLNHALNMPLTAERALHRDDDDGILKVSRREHHCLMALALAVQAISLRQNAVHVF